MLLYLFVELFSCRHDFHGRGVEEFESEDEIDLDIEQVAGQGQIIELFDIEEQYINMAEAIETSDDDFSDSDASIPGPTITGQEEPDSDYLNSSSDSEMEKEVIKAAEASSSNPNTIERRVINDYNESDEEDEVIKKIISEIKKPRSKPPNITTEDFVVDLCFHPDQDILAIGTVSGDVLIYKYTNEQNTLLYTHEVHTKAIRDIEFSIDGKDIFSASRDKSIMITDFETGKLKRFWDNAHDEPIYTLSVLDENLIASGDDDGTVRLWDMRVKGNEPIFSLKEVEDYISCITTNNQKRMLLCTSGDGYLTTINIASRFVENIYHCIQICF